MNTTPTLAEITETSDRAWELMNDCGRVCARLLSTGYDEAARIAAAEFQVHRDWWVEIQQQHRDLLKERGLRP